MKFAAISSLILMTVLPSAAQGAQAEPEPDIVVSAQREAEARKEAQAYIRELGVLSNDRPVARWVDRICPRARGLSKEHAAIVERQIRLTAREAGAPVAGENCTANFVVIFTEDAGSLMRIVAQREPSRLARRGAARDRDLENSQAPITWWYNTGVKASSGLAEGTDAPPSAKFSDYSGAETPMPGNSSTTVTNHYNASLVSTQLARAIYSATIIVDVNRAQGNRLKSIVDYATLVGLAEIDFGSKPGGSILSLFEPAEAHRELSPRDRAFLSGLYRIPLDRKLGLQRNRLANEIVQRMSGSSE